MDVVVVYVFVYFVDEVELFGFYGGDEGCEFVMVGCGLGVGDVVGIVVDLGIGVYEKVV